MSITLILGGARSGKSAYAQTAAETAQRQGRLVFIATAEAHDDEMRDRIDQHRQVRGPIWTTVEAPLHLTQAISTLTAGDIAVIDCLTLWFNNLLMHTQDTHQAAADLQNAVARCSAAVWIVSNEVGMGIVPDNALARRYRDEMGRLHQDLAKIAASVMLIVAGIPMRIK